MLPWLTITLRPTEPTGAERCPWSSKELLHPFTPFIRYAPAIRHLLRGHGSNVDDGWCHDLRHVRKSLTFAYLALDLDTTAMGFDNPGADGQPKTRAFLGMGPRIIGAIEPVEDPRLILLRDSNTVIGHGHPCVSLFDRQRDVDGAAGVRVLDCVIEKIQEQLAQA